MSAAPCASGLKGANGYCPAIANAPETAEGRHVMRLVKRLSSWTGGGMSRLRLDRAQILRRMPNGLCTDAAEELMDVAEQSAGAALAARSAKPGDPPRETTGARPARPPARGARP